MIMISVNNSAGSTGLRMNCRDRENKENQMDFLGAGWQGKQKKEASNGEKISKSWGTQLGCKTQIYGGPAWSWAEQCSNCEAALMFFLAKQCRGEQERQVSQDQVQART